MLYVVHGNTYYYGYGYIENIFGIYAKKDDAEAAKEFTLEDFSIEHLASQTRQVLEITIDDLNDSRSIYLKTKNKGDWWQMIQLLPSSYNQTRNVMLNYEVLANIYKSRKDHKLDEWREFCKWIEEVPYSELITGGFKNEQI